MNKKEWLMVKFKNAFNYINPSIKSVFFSCHNTFKNRIALKNTIFIILLIVYISLILGIGSRLNKTYPIRNADVYYTFIPRTFFNPEKMPKIRLSFTDEVLELKDSVTTKKLKVSVSPDYIKALPLIFESSDTEVAEVLNDGSIIPINNGETYISVTVDKLNRTAYAKLTVIDKINSLFILNSNLTIYTGDNENSLEVRAFPDNHPKIKLTFKSKDESIVKVSKSGRLTPVSEGITEVTVTNEDGTVSAKSFVTVVNSTRKVDKIVVEEDKISLRVGDVKELNAKVLPKDAKNKTIYFMSSDEDVVTVSQDGKIRARAKGEATVTLRSSNAKVAKVDVIVTDRLSNASGISYNESEINIKNATYERYENSIFTLSKLQMSQTPPPKIWRGNGAVNATLTEVMEYINPLNYCDEVYKYQFLNIGEENGVSVDALNDYLDGKGILEGQGEAFKRAAQMYDISEVYLVAHAALESGNGTSQLSNGVSVNGKVVYNMFGIAAYDNSPLSSGSKKAYDEGWTSVEKSILGGAKWISENYINNPKGKQNTLYKMLWNPKDPATHQYATDISWATSQAKSISMIFKSFPDAKTSFIVPIYSN